MFDALLDQVEGEERLTSAETDDAPLGKKRMEDVDGPGQDRGIKELLSPLLITIGACEIALVRQDKGEIL